MTSWIQSAQAIVTCEDDSVIAEKWINGYAGKLITCSNLDGNWLVSEILDTVSERVISPDA